ncbi:hypothetical protein ABZ370_23310 [Streptomyces sp. NPDC005962]|uniref:hypothetical protein n=1 Tax=Streptomyces sp. NPDC005962 TaxID=3154466 RepID=UPI0033C3985D
MALTTGPRSLVTQRQVRGMTAAALVLAVLTGVIVWFAGSDDRALDEACGGALAADEVRTVLGDSGMDVTSGTEGTFGGDSSDSGSGGSSGSGNSGGSSLAVRCAVTAEGRGRVGVTIAGAPRPRAEHGTGELYTAVPARDTLPVPIGHGWSGLLATDNARRGDRGDGKATAAVLLDCARGGRSLLITVETTLRGATLDDPATRPSFVSTAIATARRADDRWDCGARLGKPVRGVGLPVNADEYEPLLGATGTCATVPTAARSAVSTARETARARAPREICALGARDGAPRYRLDAYYGPYAEDARAQYTRYGGEGVTPADKPAGRLGRSAYWAGADCPDGARRALYLIRADDADGDARARPDLGYERAALAAFAARSAEDHGCAAPVTP